MFQEMIFTVLFSPGEETAWGRRRRCTGGGATRRPRSVDGSSPPTRIRPPWTVAADRIRPGERHGPGLPVRLRTARQP